MAHSPSATEAQNIEELLARSAVYHGLSVVLRRPDAETATWLTRNEHRRLPELIGLLERDGLAHPLEAARRLATALGSVSILEWTRGYERVFGHAVQGVAPPYELEYGEEHSHRQPQELSDIAAFYTAFGLQVSKAAHERVDHIVTECEFMQYLLYKQACAFEEGAKEQADVCEAAARQFLADHLGRWGPAFALRLSRTVSEGLLAAVADVLLAWLVQECARQEVPLGSCDLPLRSPKEQDAVGCAACALPQKIC
jgi:TorA maturation chaperone TorD